MHPSLWHTHLVPKQLLNPIHESRVEGCKAASIRRDAAGLFVVDMGRVASAGVRTTSALVLTVSDGDHHHCDRKFFKPTFVGEPTCVFLS